PARPCLPAPAAPPTEPCALSLHAALPISNRHQTARPGRWAPWSTAGPSAWRAARRALPSAAPSGLLAPPVPLTGTPAPSVPRTEIGRAHVELQSRENLVCRLLLEKTNRHK